MRTILLLLLSLATFRPCLGQEKKLPLLVDTDFGNYLDDPCALALLLASPELQLRGITTSGGDTEDRAWMVGRLLTMLDRRDIPVAWGRDPQPRGEVKEMFQYRYHPAVIFNRTFKPVPKDAAELLHEQLAKQPQGETVMLALGPLTNIARLFAQHPESTARIKRLVILGGKGVRDEAPEWNFQQDVKAAQAVFAVGVPITLVPADVAAVKLAVAERKALFAAQTILTQQLQLLHELLPEETPLLFDAVAAAVAIDPTFGKRQAQRIEIDDRGIMSLSDGKHNAEVVTAVDVKQFAEIFARVPRFGQRVIPRELTNWSKVIPRGGLPARVHAFEDYETDIERRWWLAGRVSSDAPQGKQAQQSVLTLDFDDRQGDLKSLYSAVVFNPVPGPPMGPRTRLSFRYKLTGTDQLRVQLYSLSNGYHRYLALRNLPQNEWREATVDMTDMRRPDGTGGELAEDERIDDIQFYVQPQARVTVDDVVLYDAAAEGEKEPFPRQIVFTGWFDTGKQGKEWPGDYEIVEHAKPGKWKAAKSIPNPAGDGSWLRVSFRGERPVGEVTAIRFRYRLQGAEAFTLKLRCATDEQVRTAEVRATKQETWEERTIVLATGKPRQMNTASELVIELPKNAELLVDDVLVYEPGQ